MSTAYKLDDNRNPVPCSLSEGGRLFEDPRRIVAQDRIGEASVSTVFLVFDHQTTPGGSPLLFETLVFGGPLDGEQARCSTWEQAEEQHRAMLKRVLAVPMAASADDRMIVKAQLWARHYHAGQTRRYTGEPYIFHPTRVRDTAFVLGMSGEAQAAAYLHDVVEDCGVTLDQIEESFGPRVRELVDLLSDLQTPEDGNRATRKRRYAERLAASGDAEAQTLKLLDLVDNAASIRDHDPKFWKVYREEARALLDLCTVAHYVARGDLYAILTT